MNDCQKCFFDSSSLSSREATNICIEIQYFVDFLGLYLLALTD